MTLRIRERDVREVEDWFEGYVQLFKTGDEERQRNITLKEEHTRRVCTEIGNIGRHPQQVVSARKRVFIKISVYAQSR